MKSKILLLSALFALFALSSCGKIPEAYRGNFVDKASGTQLSLESGAGTLTDVSGHVLKHDADSLDVKDLEKGKAGLYTRSPGDGSPLDKDDKEVEVFWIVPNATTKIEDHGFVSFQAEVLYTRMRTDLKDKVQSFKMLHCMDGMILIDLPSKTWNGGCPGSSQELVLERVAEKK